MIVETAILVCWGYGVQTRRSEDAHIQFDSAARCQSIIQPQCPKVVTGFADTTADVLSKDFGAIPQVDYVLAEELQDAMLVWIVVSDANPDVRDVIFDKQLSLISEFPEIPFDFNLIRTEGRQPSQLVSGARIIFSRGN